MSLSDSDADADKRLEEQLRYLRSDDRLRERAARAAEMTVAERLSLTYTLCRRASAMRGQLSPAIRARVASFREPLGPGAEAALRRFSRLASPGVP